MSNQQQGESPSKLQYANHVTSKHALVRQNPDEAYKLNRIEKELCSRTELVEVDNGTDPFEKETNYMFNEHMDKEGVGSHIPI